MHGALRADGLDTEAAALVLTASPDAEVSPQGGIGIIRSLGRMGIPVHIVDSDPGGPGSSSKFLRGRFVFDLAHAAPEASVDFLVETGRQMGDRPVLIPTWDEAALLVSQNADRLADFFRFPRQPAGLPGSLASKKEMVAVAQRHGIPTPAASFPANIGDVQRFATDATFPVMLKGISGNRLLQRTGHKMLIVQTADQLLQAYEEMEDPAAPNLMLQEYIPGGEDTVWMFNGYFDEASDCLFGITGRKLRQTPIRTGSTSLGVCEPNAIVDSTTRRWMKELGYRGILDIGYRYDERDDTYKVLDVNPRIGGTFRLFVASNGMDVARAYYLDLIGQPVEAGRPIPGRKWIATRDVQTALQHWREGNLTVRDYLRSLVGVRETVYFALDDPVPFLRLLRGLLSFGRAPKNRPVTTVSQRSSTGPQAAASRYFKVNADKWRTVYAEHSVPAVIYGQRGATALSWIDELHLPSRAPLLEVGCGAGLTSVALAERGLDVTATDPVPQMIALTEGLARDRRMSDRIRTVQADAHDLPFEEDAFEVVLALGVIPWLHDPGRAMAELARVTRPGGYILATSDNALRLDRLLDPRRSPLLAMPRRLVGAQLRRARLVPEPHIARFDTPSRFRDMVEHAGLYRKRETTIGFGPFTFFGRPVFSDSTGIALHRALQARADRGSRLSGLGAQQLVLAQRLPAGPMDESSS